MLRVLPIAVSFMLLVVMGCSKTPDNVIAPNRMAELLADIHMGEGVVEINRTEWRSDSSKLALREAIYMRHGVTQAQVDSSYNWYGRHLDQYMDVYEKVIDILQNELEHSDAEVTRLQMAVAGDSADAWNLSMRYIINELSPSPVLAFSLNPDEHWEKGDIYTWNVKILNSRSKFNWLIGTEYSDGEIEWKNETIDDNGSYSISLVTDSTKTMERVYGFIDLTPAFNEWIFVDSISLIRTRTNRQSYSKRFSQKKMKTKLSNDYIELKKEVQPDTMVVENDTLKKRRNIRTEDSVDTTLKTQLPLTSPKHNGHPRKIQN